ncbi:MAG: NYN domain-containing protein, partial [Salinivirgaceae bacterium]
QYGYTSGKNATDSAMIIDAMDILYSNKVNGFCLVSSDSDFTRLATRLREAGMLVIGIGEKKTPSPFIVACDKFIYVEILKQQTDKEPGSDKTETKSSVDKITSKVINLISTTVSDLSDDDGWAFLGDVGGLLQKKQPNFDSRNYGFEKLTPLIKSTGQFDIEQRENPKSKNKLIYVKKKEIKGRTAKQK